MPICESASKVVEPSGSEPALGWRLGWLGVAALMLGCMKSPASAAAASPQPGVEPSATFELAGKPFCFAGANNYYPIYKSRAAVSDVFAAARALGFRVMRVWAMLDRGSLDGSVPNVDGAGHKQGVYFQYWDAARQRPAYNDGPDGLQRLDHVLQAAAEHDIKLIIVLTNNWREFGGMDQYLVWYGKQQHHEFFTAPELRQAYRDWAYHVVTRQSALTGLSYREDPTIFGWELANEPRCKNASAFDSDSGWDHDTLTRWAHEMSSYVKSLDPNHLVSVGDEGFLNQGGEHWTYRGQDGVDHRALTALPNVDFGTFHLYPEHWGMPPSSDERWISDHLRIARELGKPTLLEEYGSPVVRAPDNRGALSSGWPLRQSRYRRWNELLLEQGGGAALAWMLAGVDDDGQRYPDFDGFSFQRDDETGRLLGGYAARFASAPACQIQTEQAEQTAAQRQPSAFVRVRRPPRSY
ncbi:MAG TPA: cellulase family glycosylhydrolase [Polyangiaceae bacterium]